jgi:hypothetical protein
MRTLIKTTGLLMVNNVILGWKKICNTLAAAHSSLA